MMTAVLQSTLDLLRVKQQATLSVPHELSIYRGQSVDLLGNTRVFGGQLLGQALMAAAQSVQEQGTLHSLHAYFLRPSDPQHVIDYEVLSLRNGTGFSARQVSALQQGRLMFTMQASFQKPEEGVRHQAVMPNVPAPDQLRSLVELKREAIATMPESYAKRWLSEQAIDMRPVEHYREDIAYVGAKRHIWVRANGLVPSQELSLHQALLAYVSDFYLLLTALLPHGLNAIRPDLRVASLDHAMWFHRPVNMNEWLLYCIESPNAYGARGFCRGQFFNQRGELIASTAQEGLIRHLK